MSSEKDVLNNVAPPAYSAQDYYEGKPNAGYQGHQDEYPPQVVQPLSGQYPAYPAANQPPPQPGYPAPLPPHPPGAPPQQIIMMEQQGSPSQSYLAFSIFTCLCCFWPVGIAAIIFSVRASEKNGRRDYVGAASSAHSALVCCIIALVIGCVWIIAVIALSVTGHLYTQTVYHHYPYSG